MQLIKQGCEHCGSKKTHPLASDPSKVICQMCGKVTKIGAPPPLKHANPSKEKSNRGGDTGGRMRWKEEEDELLISICEDPTLKIAEIHKKYCELKRPAWFNRTLRSVKNRVQKLRGWGILKYRYKPYQTFKCPYCKGEFHIVVPKAGPTQ